jgi:hypothetical protein
MYDKSENPENAQRYHNQDIDMENICYDSEKVAIAFTRISTPPALQSHIFMDLRMFAECHIATNFIAVIVERVTYCKRWC